MGLRILVAVLVLTLSGVNCGLASFCAAYCMSSATARSAIAHPDQMKSQLDPATTSQNHDNGADCAECPPMSGNNLKQKADCANMDQMQTLKEDTFNLDDPRGLALFDVAETPVRAVGTLWVGERSLVFDASRTIRSFPSSSLPLRI